MDLTCRLLKVTLALVGGVRVTPSWGSGESILLVLLDPLSFIVVSV